MRSALLTVLVAGGLLSAGPAAAQGLTGTLIVTVKDEQGLVVPGATVRLSAPVLMGGPITQTTDPLSGRVRFLTLAPGSYALEVEHAGFPKVCAADIPIGAGATIELPFTLKVGHAESVVVAPADSRIDQRSSPVEWRFGPETLGRFPTRRFGPIDPIRFAPGMSATAYGNGTASGVSAAGGGTNENGWFFDGNNFTCPCSGEARSEPGVDFMSEIQITFLPSAEFGNVQGAVINVVTRQGTNRFLYDAAYYGQPAVLTSQPVRLTIPESTDTSGYERAKYRDATTSLGGPIRRDFLWFFAGYQYLRDYDSQPGTDPLFPRTYEQNKLFVKLNWRLSPTLQLMQSFHQELWVNPEAPTREKPFDTTVRRHAWVPAITFAHLTHTLSSRTVWDIRGSMFVSDRTDDPSSGNFAAVSRWDETTKRYSGGPQTIGGVKLIRTTVKGTVNHLQEGFLGADHQWRFGGQIEKGEHRALTIIPTDIRYVDRKGENYQSVSGPPSSLGGVFITPSAFVSDAITVGDAFTANLGIRFDHSRAVSQDMRAVDNTGQETGAVIPGEGALYTWNVFSPRLGITWRLTADGRTMFRWSYGVFHQGVLTGEIGPFHPGAATITTADFDPLTQAYTRNPTDDGPRNLELDENIRTPRTEELSVSVDREVGRGLAIGVAYIRKDGRDFIGWTDVGGSYRPRMATLPDGTELPVLALENSRDDRRYQLTNPDGYSMTYNGLVIAVDRRRAHGWSLFGSYTYSKTVGLQPTSGAAASATQASTVAGVPIITFGRDPNDLTNARGPLPNDRPHMFKVMGSVDVPRTGLAVAANLQHVSGKPWAATAIVKGLPQGDRRILIEPAGSRRLSTQTLLDFRVSRSFALPGNARVDLLVDVLNALNDTAEEALATDDKFSVKGNFGQPSVYVDPRRVMLGVRFNFGR
jgi:hypothetical protein